MQTNQYLNTNKLTNKTKELENHFFSLGAVASAAAFTKVEGLIALFGFKAFLILNTAHAVPIACPAASSPSFVTFPASSPYLYIYIISIYTINFACCTYSTDHHTYLRETSSVVTTADVDITFFPATSTASQTLSDFE